MAPVTPPIMPLHTASNISFFPERNTSKSSFSFFATMAPLKVAAPKKGKAPMQASQPAAASGSTEPVGALPKSRVGPAGIATCVEELSQEQGDSL